MIYSGVTRVTIGRRRGHVPCYTGRRRRPHRPHNRMGPQSTARAHPGRRNTNKRPLATPREIPIPQTRTPGLPLHPPSHPQDHPQPPDSRIKKTKPGHRTGPFHFYFHTIRNDFSGASGLCRPPRPTRNNSTRSVSAVSTALLWDTGNSRHISSTTADSGTASSSTSR